MDNFFLILTGMAFGAILLVVSKLMLEYRQVITAKILSLMLLSAACYMLQSFVSEMFFLQLFLGVGAMLNPALFWMFATTLFQVAENNKTLHIGHYTGLAVCIALGTYQCFQSPAELEGSIIHTISLVATSSLTLLGLLAVFRNWQSDLVECRRFLRLGLSVTSGFFLLFIVVNEFIYGHSEFPAFLNYLNITVICIFAMAFGYVILVSDYSTLSFLPE